VTEAEFDSRDAAQACIVCGESAVSEFLDLGRTALANKFLTREELAACEPTYPLRVGFCERCGHVQLTDTVPPAAMFEEYLYISSASDTLKHHFQELSDLLVARHRLTAADLVIDIGCNDGSLLGSFRRNGIRTLGVDPAANLRDFTDRLGVECYTGFFGAKTAERIVERWGQAALVTATNTFPHIPDLTDFVQGIQTVLQPGGVFIIEAHYLVDVLEQVAFDTVYHEHKSYWALGPMQRLFERHGFQIVDAERLPIHHGQIRVTVREQGQQPPSPRVATLLEAEAAAGLRDRETYRRFATKVLAIRSDLARTLGTLRASGKRVVGYGAPAKGSTLLSFLQVDSRVVEYIVDRSRLKQGRYTPGTHIAIVAPEQLLADQPDYVLLLAWNFADEILQQQGEYVRRGGRFIIPVPHVQIVPEHAPALA
jgi:predicted TPR repeat methyltransferase